MTGEIQQQARKRSLLDAGTRKNASAGKDGIVLNRNERYIVSKSKWFLVGCPFDEKCYVNLRENIYDAYRMTDFNKALIIARMIDGRVFKFNTITGSMEGGWK